MKKLNKFVPLLILPLLLTACDKPSIHKPGFARYGSRVSIEDFNYRLSNKIIEVKKYYTIKDKTLLSPENDYSIKSIISGYEEVVSGNTKTKSALEMTETLKIDCDSSRAKSEVIVKQMWNSNLTKTDSNYKPDSKIKQKQESYVELVDGDFRYLDITNKRYRQFSINSDYFAYYTLNYCSYYSGSGIESMFFETNTYVNDADEAMCYINGNVFTIVQKMRDETGTSDAVMQLKYSKSECTFKAYSKTTYNFWVSNENRAEEGKGETSYDLSIKRTKLSVSKYDLSKYAKEYDVIYY